MSDKLTELRGKLKYLQFGIKKLGMKTYFESEQAKYFISSVENERKCAISVIEDKATPANKVAKAGINLAPTATAIKSALGKMIKVSMTAACITYHLIRSI